MFAEGQGFVDVVPRCVNNLHLSYPTGQRQRFPAPAVLGFFYARGIGCEVMATDAACRTYNVLVAEDRRVALALLFDGVV